MKIFRVFQRNQFEAKNDAIFFLKVNVPFILFWIVAIAFDFNERWRHVAWSCVWWMAIMNAVGLSIQFYEYIIRVMMFNVFRVKRHGSALFPMSLLGFLTWFLTFLALFVIILGNAALLKGFWIVAPRIIIAVLVVWTLVKLFFIRK